MTQTQGLTKIHDSWHFWEHLQICKRKGEKFLHILQEPWRLNYSVEIVEAYSENSHEINP